MEEIGIFYHWRAALEHALLLYRKGRDKLGIRNLFFVLFLFFLVINITCYWIGVRTAYPELLTGPEFEYYFKIQFPVGILGAIFDSFSFFATIYLIICAINSKKRLYFLGFLSLDLVIAAIATLWVLFIFQFSGWLIGNFSNTDSTISQYEIGETKSSDPIKVELSVPTSNKTYDKNTSIPSEENKNTLIETSNVNLEIQKTQKLKSIRSYKERVQDYEKLVDSMIEEPESNFRNFYFGLLMGISTLIPTLIHFYMALISIIRTIKSKVQSV